MSNSAEGSRGVRAAVFGALAIAICCGGPLLLLAVATTGVGTALAALGWSSLGVAVVIVGLASAGWWWLRRRSVNECGSTAPKEVTQHG